MTDADILAKFPQDGSRIGIRALSAALDTTPRKLGPVLERLARDDHILILRPGRGVQAEREVCLDGKRALAALIAECGRLRTTMQSCAEQLLLALETT